jgi:hypothetical protein
MRLFGARVGIVCHDGSYQLWEWNEAKTAFVPLMLSSPSAFAVFRLITNSYLVYDCQAAHLRETDCVAGHVGLELRYVVTKYPFESRAGFPRI